MLILLRSAAVVFAVPEWYDLFYHCIYFSLQTSEIMLKAEIELDLMATETNATFWKWFLDMLHSFIHSSFIHSSEKAWCSRENKILNTQAFSFLYNIIILKFQIYPIYQILFTLSSLYSAWGCCAAF